MSAVSTWSLAVLLVVINAGWVQGCTNPMGLFRYRLGGKPKQHKSWMPGETRWQEINAIDFLVPDGTPVYAIVNGTVCSPPTCVVGKTEKEKKDKYSLNSFTLIGQDNQTYYYTHLKEVGVKAGQRIVEGQRVGTAGAYNGKNSHLHLAVKKGSPCVYLAKCKPVDVSGCA